jgi:hypothetical protein
MDETRIGNGVGDLDFLAVFSSTYFWQLSLAKK